MYKKFHLCAVYDLPFGAREKNEEDDDDQTERKTQRFVG